MKMSAKFSILCGILGLIIPMLLIIFLGLLWIIGGHPLQISLTPGAMLPDLHTHGVIMALTGIMLSFCGMEITTVYAQEVKKPQHDYPKAMLIAVIILVGTLAFGSLAIAIVIPKDNISLVAGLMEAFRHFFDAYHLRWLVPILAVMIILGGLGGLSNWIIAPSKGLIVAAQDGHLTESMTRSNKHGAPVGLLFFQAIITTIVSLVFLFMPGVNGSFWILTVLAAQLYMFMYIIMFAAGIYLSFTRPELERPFHIPGGKMGMLIVAGLGIFSSIITVIVSFIPPDTIEIGSFKRYEILLLIGLLLMSLPPLLLPKRASRKQIESHELTL